jgi:hypothetical protein
LWDRDADGARGDDRRSSGRAAILVALAGGHANSPDPTGIDAPVFVAQGLADAVVAPEVTETWVADRCSGGAPTTWATYPDVSHPAIVGPGGNDALTWTIDRFDDVPLTGRCPG